MMQNGSQSRQLCVWCAAVRACVDGQHYTCARARTSQTWPHRHRDAPRAHVQAWTNLGVLLREQADYAAAQRTFQEALARAPAHPVVLANLAALYVLIGNQGGTGARAAYERALAYEPTNTDALYNLGVLEAAAERWETALFFYQTCVRLHPKHTLAWNNLGVVYQQVSNLACAIECYEAAVASKPDFWLSLNNLGVIYTTQGQSTRGSRHLRAAIAAQPAYAEAHNNLGVLLRDMGLVREARCPPRSGEVVALGGALGGVCEAWHAGCLLDRAVIACNVHACLHNSPAEHGACSL